MNSRQIATAHGSKIPSLCVFLDTETTSRPGARPGVINETFRLAVAIKVQRESGKWNRRTVERFTDAGALWDWIHGLESRQRPVWIFAHNVGFDLTVSGFWDRVDRGDWTIADVWADVRDRKPTVATGRKQWRGTIVITDPPTILVLRSRTGSIRIVDSFNYFRGPLSDLAASVGMDQKSKPAPEDLPEVWFERCQRDAEILECAFCNWLGKWADLDCGTWSYTAASLGYRSWRNCLTEIKVFPDHSERQLHYAREANFWGQTEVYYQGEVKQKTSTDRLEVNRRHGRDRGRPAGPIYHLDVHALYPSVMRDRAYPRKFLGWDESISIEQLTARAKFHLPIAHVRIESETETYPARRNGRVMFAAGSFSTFLCGDELAGAIARGHVKRVIGVCWYEPADLFSRFVGRWIDLRHQWESQGDKAGAELAKLVANSISGKFSQRRVVWVERPEIAPLLRFGEWSVYNATESKLTRFRAIAGQVQEFTTPGESRDSFPAISAVITANGRERMRQLRSICPAGSVLYQDTDSLMVTEAGFRRLRPEIDATGKTPGKLKIEAVYAWLEIRGFKFYGSDRGVVCPGLKKSARPDRPGGWSQTRFQRLAEKLAAYDGPFIEVSETDFTPVGSIGTRRRGQNGWTIEPRLME